MSSVAPQPIRQDPAVEFLAYESNTPVDDVARLYGKELTALGIGARVTAFLPVFAFRKVRELLRLRALNPIPA